MFQIGNLVLAAAVIGFVAASSDDGYGNRPRGVPLKKAALYKAKIDFECLDGSKAIPFEQVNDDYCDCADGSDEPGTSACSNGRFHCINLGFRPKEVSSSKVNDYICDCCDGSDEWDSGVQCPNICNELGAKDREEAERYKKVVAAGFLKRADLAKEGEKLVKEKAGGVDGLRKQLEDLQPLKTLAETQKTEAETKEREAVEVEDKAWATQREERRKVLSDELFKKLDVNGDNKLTFDDLKSVKEFDKDGNGEVSEEEAKDFLAGNEALEAADFLEKAFTNVRRTIRDHQFIKKEESAEKKDEELDGLEDEPEPAREEEEDELDKRPPYSAETQRIIDEATKARNEFNDASNKVSELENSIRDAEKFIEFDYGSDHAWAALKGQCFELEENQYVYKLCMFDKTLQKDKNGYSEVPLGYWDAWSGAEDNKYSHQIYKRGQNCWNGPDRSTAVEIRCGEETKLIEASEPAKCEYKFVLQSPAACDDPAKIEQLYHSEL